MENKKNIFITGVPGVGKTTLITRLCDGLKEFTAAGFYTTEIREGGARKGFSLVSLHGRRSILAHVEIKSRFVVGRYGVDVSGFEEFLDSIDLAHSNADVIVMDEIGKMECSSQRFKDLLLGLLDSRKMVVATIALKGNEFISKIRKRLDAQLYEITDKNRDSLVLEILNQLEKTMRREKVTS
jgi:nucleoside-triphosphatase